VNSVALIGRLTANHQTHAAELHETATFRLAVARKGSDGADFVDIVTFDKRAARLPGDDLMFFVGDTTSVLDPIEESLTGRLPTSERLPRSLRRSRPSGPLRLRRARRRVSPGHRPARRGPRRTGRGARLPHGR
jgi:hypothetical protein